jgi:nucleotide-binding universal stress UspA family protein
MLPIHTILHPTDFSCSSTDAFTVAGALARDYGARLVLLHVVDEPMFIDGTGLVPFDSAMYRSEMWDKLEQLAVRAESIEVERQLAEGNPVKAILDAAAETHCDLIVLGTHGWTGLRRLLMGSIAEAVTRKAPCPVMTVRAPVEVPAKPCEAPSRELAAAAR